MSASITAIYGQADHDLAPSAADAVQLSPLIAGSRDVASVPDESFTAVTVRAPAGAVERRFVLAQALRILAPGGRMTAFAPKDRGGLRLKKELEALGCEVGESARRHNRICLVVRPAAPKALDEAIAAGAPRQIAENGLWTQPGVFSWDRLDAGTNALLQVLPPFAGVGSDFGAGIGLLALNVLASPKVTKLTLVELDRRALDLARRNVADPRADFVWGDVRQTELKDLDFIVSNPPFHEGGGEDKTLGQAFIASAAAALRKGGVLWMVANRHLPYEAILGESFAKVGLVAEGGGYKVFEARK
ncbi:class I SAM-dependent methyltransferase [Caulobacter sp. 602-1]|uniref:class I SAM-dependent methyltransferase n=1 Tax=Caulobacter sp. 602-1 TaxID=2492472 RepID=UPI000F63D200|nr:class I SAM-dependent methyltransferase [Caulobacter sp. 602-1]RRN63025.1 class I SAM-dependent methyltransferase [Caulobacter sp. 602-1]